MALRLYSRRPDKRHILWVLIVRGFMTKHADTPHTVAA